MVGFCYNRDGDILIHYPTKKNTLTKSTVNRAKLGMTLEEDLNKTNHYYLEFNKAVIYKKPTPIQVVSVLYPQRSRAKITEAYYRSASTTDYNGVCQGVYIDFEAKETNHTTYFALAKIHSHQIDHLKRVAQHGGIAFLIIRFSTLDVTYIVSIEQLCDFIANHARRSIPVEWFKENAVPIPVSLTPPVDYLSVIQPWITKRSAL